MKENKETLLIIDEAQLLERSNLEEVRLLLNFQLNDRFLMTILLIGQPELRDNIKNIKQLDQRIAIKYHLAPFNFNETVQYVFFRHHCNISSVANVFCYKPVYSKPNCSIRKIKRLATGQAASAALPAC